jgi:hypothetical protein
MKNVVGSEYGREVPLTADPAFCLPHSELGQGSRQAPVESGQSLIPNISRQGRARVSKRACTGAG